MSDFGRAELLEPEAIGDPGQRTFRLHYNASGMLSTVTRPDDSTIDYHYEDSAFSKGLTGVSDSRQLEMSPATAWSKSF